MTHLAVAHSRHEKEFKENAIALIAGGKKLNQLLRIIRFGLLFNVAWPIALLQQSRNVISLEELRHDRKLVVGGPGIVLLFADEKRREMLQVLAIDLFEVALRARLLKMFKSYPVRLIRFHLLARRGAIQI